MLVHTLGVQGNKGADRLTVLALRKGNQCIKLELSQTSERSAERRTSRTEWTSLLRMRGITMVQQRTSNSLAVNENI
jgi:hypothetical protein